MSERRQDRLERQKRHPVWRSRRVAGMTLATFSHWSDEEPPKDLEKSEEEQK